MKKIMLALVLSMAWLSGCAVQNTKEQIPTTEPDSVVMTAMPDEIPVLTPSKFSFDEELTEGWPSLHVEVFESKENDKEWLYEINISGRDTEEIFPQTFEISSNIQWDTADRAAFIDLVDIDFDGCRDLQILGYREGGNSNYLYYRWNVFETYEYGRFEEYPFFEMRTASYELLPDSRQILNTVTGEPEMRAREIYQLSDTRNGGWLGQYRLTRWEIWEPMPNGTDKGHVTARVFFDHNEIYAETVPFSDGAIESTSTLDNHLRFGAGYAVDMKTAVELLSEELGDSYSFMFEEMVLHEGLSCYKYRVQWLVDGSHWSTIGFYDVTPDGRIFESE